MNWLLLRGLGREKAHWLDFPDKLREKNGEILCIDLPGFGEEGKTKPPFTIAGHTEYLREKFFAKRKSKNNWGILGISLGGMIALDWVARYPEDFNKIVIINSSARDLSSIIQRLTPFALYISGRNLISKTNKDRELLILKMVSNLRADDADLLKKMTTLRKKSKISPERLARQMTAASQFDSPAKISIPMLVLASMKDRMVDVRCSKALADKYHAQIKFHPTAGHDLPLDDADWVAERVHEFQHSEPAPT